jgi:hypothetical protein
MRLPLPNGAVPSTAFLPPFTLERQCLAHNEADYAAVMASREFLREWSGDEWPEDSFSLEQNAEDLAGHLADAETEFAFGYTVFNDDGATVAGSVYLYPSAWFAERYEVGAGTGAEMVEGEVCVDYWLRPEIEASPRHLAFLLDLLRWLGERWGYDSSLWASRPGMSARRALYAKAGMRLLVEAESLQDPGRRMSFHCPA